MESANGDPLNAAESTHNTTECEYTMQTLNLQFGELKLSLSLDGEAISQPEAVPAARPKAVAVPKPTAPVVAQEAPKEPAQEKPQRAAKPTKRTASTRKAQQKAEPAQEKAPKQDAKAILAEVRQLTKKGEFDKAMALCPKGWVQEIQAIARAVERSGQTVTLNPATVGAKPRSAKKAKPQQAKRSKTAQPATATVASVEAPAKRVTKTEPAQEAAQDAANKAADSALDLGADRDVVELVRSTRLSVFAQEIRERISREDPADLWVELTELGDEFEQAAQRAAAANDRDLAETLDAWIAALEAAGKRLESLQAA